ncbi:DUF192 domain-containing protein [Hoeflea sp.]|uniref:DUF192 domain-containing protein n=1 Tax=Hoeflea sp. TaxID=1940281 RepID=UPI003A8E96CE
MRIFKRSAFFAVVALIVAIPALAMTAQLPTDSERLVIETEDGPVSFSVELALTPEDRASGLMNREDMPEDHGMLFKFEQARQVLMWMKNTPLPLDMIFIDSDGTIARIAKDTTPFSETIIPSVAPVRYVLELNGGTATKRGISVGNKVRHRVIGK